jgi:tetratricopeptide (TPR) repeat protein
VDEIPPPPRSWRKRHPVLARAVLYGLGLAVGGLLFWLLVLRGETDRQDRHEALRAELDQLAVVLQADPQGTVLLRALEDRYSDPSLPLDVRQRAARWRGYALHLAGRADESNRAYATTAMLDLPRREMGALYLEWARCRLERGEADEALFLLDRPVIVGTGPLGLLGATIRARARVQEGGSATEAARGLLWRLEEASRAPRDGQVDWVCPVEWRLEEAAVTAAEEVASLLGAAEASPEPWRLLARIAPDHFEAQWKCARAFHGLGLKAEAREALGRARRIDSRELQALARREPALAALLEAD